MKKIIPRFVLVITLALALVALLAVGGVGATGSDTRATQEETTTSSMEIEISPIPLASETNQVLLIPLASTTTGLDLVELITLFQSYRGFIGVFIGLVIGIIGTTTYSRTRGTLAEIDHNLSMVKRGTREEPDRRPQSPLTPKGFQMWWSRKFGIQADETAKDLADLFTDNAIGNRIVANVHQEYGGSETADGPIQQLEEIQSTEEVSATDLNEDTTGLDSTGGVTREQGASASAGEKQPDDSNTIEEGIESDSFEAICSAVREKVDLHEESSRELLDAVDPSVSVAAGSVEMRLIRALQKIAEYDRIEKQLPDGNIRADGELADNITTLVNAKDDKIEQKQNQIDRITSEVEQLRPKAEAFDTMVDELDSPWLREQGRVDSNPATEWLPKVTRQGLIAPTVIQTTANDVEVRGTKSGTDLINALRNPNPTQLADQLEETISQLKQYDRLYGPSGELRQPDDHEITEQIADIRSQIDGSSTPLTGMYALLDMYEDQLETINEQNDLERHSLVEGLNQVKMAVADTRDSEQSGEQVGFLASVTQLADEVSRLRQPGEYEIRTGHQVTGVFTEAAEQLTERARQAYEQDEHARARAFAEAAERIYQGVKEVYATRRLRQVLQ